MRKTIFIFIAAIVVCVCVGWIRSCGDASTDKEQFARRLTHATMYEFEDEDFGYVIRYPSFFSGQPDSLQDEVGRSRFVFNGEGATVVLEGHVMRNGGMSVQRGMDSLAEVLHATSSKLVGDDSFILSGPQYEEGYPVDGYSFHSKFVAHRQLWFVYTMVYPDRYRDVLSRLFKEIDEWQVWKQPQPRLRQGEEQTPKG